MNRSNIPFSPVLREYAPAFADADAVFLRHRHFPDKTVRERDLSRGKFWRLGALAAGVLRRAGLNKGDCFAHFFSANRVEDLAFRLGAVMTGAVPVTINWQADTLDRIKYKMTLCDVKLVVFDAGAPTDAIADLRKNFPDVSFYNEADLAAETEALEPAEFCADLAPDDTRIIIFTSGTTGQPKGVRLSYGNYVTNRATFESFLAVAPDDALGLIIANPLHHTNSTAITDWAFRRPNTTLYLMERYATAYWTCLLDIAADGHDRMVAPLVSRHFDFLENLRQENRLPVELETLRGAMANIDFLLGSAPVGPTTVGRLREFAGRIPVVRFGSTETCLQVMGTPLTFTEEQNFEIFRAGWEHTHNDQPHVGFYIGRPHHPHNEVRIVRSTDRDSADYMQPCDEGEKGELITRGGNIMTGYVKNPDATAGVLHDGGWYTGLGDICFWRTNPFDGRPDYYWTSRRTAMLIRGGANYAYDQINEELKTFAVAEYGLSPEQIDIAVVGLNLRSEHEDDCCATIELAESVSPAVRDEILATFIPRAKAAVSKGAKPDYIRLAEIPRNFKGALLIPEMKKAFAELLDPRD